MGLLYQLGLALLLVTAGPFLLLARGRHYLATLRGRLALALPAAPAGALWLHAVSVGEVAVAAVVARALPAELPLLVTTITPTGQQRALSAFAGRAAVGYLPFDLGVPVERFLRRLRPATLVLVEGDYWPLLLSRCRRRGMAVAVVNGRVGDRTFRRLSRLPRIARWLLGGVDRFAVQSEEDARRLRALGVDAVQVTVAGNLKYDAAEPPPQPALEGALRTAAAGRPLLVAGSTMAGEEEAVLAAFATSGGGDRALLVLAPRHPERWGEVARQLDAAGWAWVRRSALVALAPVRAAAEPTPRSEATPRWPEPAPADPAAPVLSHPDAPVAVVLLDSMGELAALYRLAAGCFVGGTLSGSGGHNPLEPARFGRAIAVGPSMENFRDMAARFDEAGAWRRVTGAEQLAAAWRQWLETPATARQLGERALALVERNRGALARTLAVLEPLLARVTAASAAPASAPAGAAPPAAAVLGSANPSTPARQEPMEMLPPSGRASP